MTNLNSEGMESPERLLSLLNHALISLRSAMDELKDDKLDEKLLSLIRRFLLAETLGKHTVVAIAGAQGAGKSTLLRGMYDLNGDAADWLPANEGRGERLPVLVLEEAGLTAPAGILRQLEHDDATHRYVVRDVPADQMTFARACCGENAAVLLPVLKVPPRYFKREGAAWLLLPGYEAIDRSNRDWQELMRQGFIGSTYFVVVTDATRMASAGQAQIIMDWRSGLLKDVQPIVVISKTDGKADHRDELDALRQTAAELFGMAPEATSSIVCTGSASNQAYKQRWLPELTAVLKDMTAGGVGHRTTQIQMLEKALRIELRDVLGAIERRATSYLQAGEAGEEGGHAQAKNCLEAFDEAQRKLGEAYERAVKDVLSTHTKKAWAELQNRLVERHEGIINKGRNFFNTATENERLLGESVERAWAAPGSILPPLADGLLHDTSIRLKGTGVKSSFSGEQVGSGRAASSTVLVRLGYRDQNGPIQWIEPNDPRVRNIDIIFNNSPQETDEHLRDAIQLLPALTLEYVRSASLLLPAARLMPETLDQMPAGDFAQSFARMQADFKDGSEQFREVSIATAAFIAGDVGTDGKLNLFDLLTATGRPTDHPPKTDTGPAGTGSDTTDAGPDTVSTAVATAAKFAKGAVALLAVAYLVHLGIRETRQYDYAVRARAHSMLLGIRDAHYEHFLQRFESLMKTVREELERRLRARYGLDARLMLQDRLAKAIADAKAARCTLLDELEKGGHGLLSLRAAQE